MDEEKANFYQEKLKQIKLELLGDVEKKNKSSKEETGEAVPDISDEASKSYNHQLMMNLGEQDWERLKLVEEALDSFDKGEYGICKECEEEIPVPRLNIVPFAKYCVECLNKIEKEQAAEKHNSKF
jgi:DnaK suppressor protein